MAERSSDDSGARAPDPSLRAASSTANTDGSNVASVERDDASRLHQTIIIDRPEQPRIRRVSDLFRLGGALLVMALVVLPGIAGLGTAEGISKDITSAVTTIPELFVKLASQMSSLIVLGLPLFLIGELVWRRRWRGVAIAVATGFGATLLANIVRWNAESWFSEELFAYLTNTPGLSAAGPAAVALFTGVVAIATVEGMASRSRTSIVLWVSLGGLGALRLIDNSATLPALVLSALGGYAIGVLVRYIVRTDNPRVSAAKLLQPLTAAGLEIVRMVQLDESDQGRVFALELADGSDAMAQAFDPDRRAAQAFVQVFRTLRLRTWVTRRAEISVQGVLQASAAPVLMANHVGVRSPRLLVAAEVNRRTAVYVEAAPVGLRRFADLSPDEIDPDMLRSLWGQASKLHRASVSHDRLNPACLAVDSDGNGWLLQMYYGQVATSALRMRLDRAEMLVSTAAIAGVPMAVEVAVAELGAEEVSRLPAFLQPAALNVALRSTCKQHPELIEALQDKINEKSGGEAADAARFERVRSRSVITAVALTLAAYALAGQLGSVDFAQLLSDIDWRWAGVALAGSMLSYLGAALTIRPFSPVKLPFPRWVLAQFAASFVVLVAPAAVGSAGMNVRLIQKGGAKPALAVASVGIATIVSVLTSILVLFVMGFVSQSDPVWKLSAPSGGVLYALLGVLGLIALLLAIPRTRAALAARVEPIWTNTVPRLLDVIRDPKRLALGSMGNLLTTLGYAIAIFSAVEAYGGKLNFATGALVVLGAGLVGTVAPTPGGLGAVEAALVAGLTATGLPATVALSAALLYRTVTFWFPTIPGWLSFQYLQRAEAI